VGFEDDLAAETRATRACKVATIKERMSATDKKVLDAAMSNRDKVPTEVIIRALNKSQDNVTIGRKVILRHRDQMCTCFEESS
jgi:hypothetical protein